MRELSGALAQREEQLGQLQTLTQSQNKEIQQLHDVCAQLGGVREMNEVCVFHFLPSIFNSAFCRHHLKLKSVFSS